MFPCMLLHLTTAISYDEEEANIKTKQIKFMLQSHTKITLDEIYNDRNIYNVMTYRLSICLHRNHMNLSTP